MGTKKLALIEQSNKIHEAKSTTYKPTTSQQVLAYEEDVLQKKINESYELEILEFSKKYNLKDKEQQIYFIYNVLEKEPTVSKAVVFDVLTSILGVKDNEVNKWLSNQLDGVKKYFGYKK